MNSPGEVERLAEKVLYLVEELGRGGVPKLSVQVLVSAADDAERWFARMSEGNRCSKSASGSLGMPYSGVGNGRSEFRSGAAGGGRLSERELSGIDPVLGGFCELAGVARGRTCSDGGGMAKISSVFGAAECPSAASFVGGGMVNTSSPFGRVLFLDSPGASSVRGGIVKLSSAWLASSLGT